MVRGDLPPYFLEVSLAWALGVMPLACGATAYAARNTQPSAEVSTRQAAATPGKDVAADAASVLVDLPDPIPATQTFSTADLAYDIVIEGAAEPANELDLLMFEQTAELFEADDGRIGVVISDLGTGATLSYNADAPFYPASSIKGPYVVSIYETYVDNGFVSSGEIWRYVEPTIVYSDNDAYRRLRDLCGSEFFANWAVSCGAIDAGTDDYQRFMTRYYPEMTTAQLAALWQHAFEYLGGGTEGAQELVTLFDRREESPIRAGVDTGDLTITKAGWYPEDNGEKYEATVDAGIVFDGSHGYVVAIMTNAPAELDTLANLVPGIFSARAALG